MMFHVVTTRSEMADAGKSAWQIERAIRRGDVERAYRGKFVSPGVLPDDQWLRELAVLLHRCGPSAVASHRTAARLHKLDGDWEGATDVSAPLKTGVRDPNLVRTMTLEPHHVTSLDGVTVTTVARTLIELGRFVEADLVELALESALRGDPRNPHDWNVDLLATLETWPQTPRIRGHGVLREVLARRVVGAIPTASGAETLFVQILRRIGLDQTVLRQPVVRMTVSGQSMAKRYPDFLFWNVGLAIEVDGKAWHDGEANMARDNHRENNLGAGLRILRYTGSQIRQRGGEIGAEVLAEHRRLSARGLPAAVTVKQLGPHAFYYSVK
jgi:very-short-patch-repair endonuclease